MHNNFDSEVPELISNYILLQRTECCISGISVTYAIYKYQSVNKKLKRKKPENEKQKNS